MASCKTADRTERLTLANGVQIRPPERSDRAVLATAVARPSERSPYLRFASPKPRLSERELAFTEPRGRENP